MTPADDRRSGDEAIANAAERAKDTAGRNIPVMPGIIAPEDTANLRLGPNLSDELLALIPMVGVWRGVGEADDQKTGENYRFGQQIIVSHDGGDYLNWESRSWRLTEDDTFHSSHLRETGFWRVATGPDVPAGESLELLLAHSSGVVELYYGTALTQSSWELATDVVIRSQSSVVVGGAKRLYGIVEGGDLAYVEERIDADGELRPHISARLSRFVG